MQIKLQWQGMILRVYQWLALVAYKLLKYKIIYPKYLATLVANLNSQGAS